MSETPTTDPTEATLNQIADSILEGLAEAVAIDLGDEFPSVSYDEFVKLESRVYAKLAAHFAAISTAE